MEEKLVVAVAAHSELYNPAEYSYRDRPKKDLAWRRVSEDIGVPVDVCKRRWKSLRDTYAKECRKEKDRRKSGAGAGTAQQWKFLTVMSFLEPFLSPRESSGNMARRGAEEEPVVGDDHPGEAAAAAGLSGGEDNTTQGSDNPLPEPPAAAAAAAAASSVRADASPASAPTGPQRKRARQRPTTSEPAEWEREILSTLRARSAAAPPQPYSDDQHFLLSLLPLLQKVPPQSKDYVKLEIHKLLYRSSTVLLNLEPLDSTES